jgi:hypothetical protein
VLVVRRIADDSVVDLDEARVDVGRSTESGEVRQERAELVVLIAGQVQAGLDVDDAAGRRPAGQMRAGRLRLVRKEAGARDRGRRDERDDDERDNPADPEWAVGPNVRDDDRIGWRGKVLDVGARLVLEQGNGPLARQ